MGITVPPTGSGDPTPSVATYTSSAGASGTHYQQMVTRPDVAGTVARFSRVSVNVSSSGAAVLVAGSSSMTVRVMGLFLGSTGAQTWKLQSSATDLFPAMPIAASGSFILPITGEPWTLTTAGAGLSIVQTTSVQLSGLLYYTQS